MEFARACKRTQWMGLVQEELMRGREVKEDELKK